MPMKYMAGRPEFVRVIGSLHGLLFLVYLVFALLAARAWRWPGSRMGQAIAAAVLPFGPLWFDRRVRRWLEAD